MKLLLTTIAASVLFSGAALAGDPSYPDVIERGTSKDWASQVQAYRTLEYFESGRATGRVPPKPDSVSVTTNSDGSSSTTKTYVAK